MIADSENLSGSAPIEIANLKEASEDKVQENANVLALFNFWALDENNVYYCSRSFIAPNPKKHLTFTT